jgi:hypothetical protein
MLDIFANLRYLSSVLEARDPLSIANIDSMWYSDKVYLVQRSLVYASLDPEQRVVDIACYIAGSMYVDSYLRDLGFYSGIIALMVAKLKNFLEQNVVGLLDGYNEEGLIMIFWTLLIGGLSATGKPERGWFIEHLRTVCKTLKLHTRSGAEEVLRKILWSKDWSMYLEEIWEEGLR